MGGRGNGCHCPGILTATPALMYARHQQFAELDERPARESTQLAMVNRGHSACVLARSSLGTTLAFPASLPRCASTLLLVSQDWDAGAVRDSPIRNDWLLTTPRGHLSSQGDEANNTVSGSKKKSGPGHGSRGDSLSGSRVGCLAQCLVAGQ